MGRALEGFVIVVVEGPEQRDGLGETGVDDRQASLAKVVTDGLDRTKTLSGQKIHEAGTIVDPARLHRVRHEHIDALPEFESTPLCHRSHVARLVAPSHPVRVLW